MDEDIWQEIGELRAEVEDLKVVCTTIQDYFKYLTDPVEATMKVKDENQSLNKSKVSNIFKRACQNDSKTTKKTKITEIFIINSEVGDDSHKNSKDIEKEQSKLSRKRRRKTDNAEESHPLHKRINWRENLFKDTEDSEDEVEDDMENNEIKKEDRKQNKKNQHVQHDNCVENEDKHKCITLSDPEKSQINVLINSPESGICSDVLLDKISGEYIETSHEDEDKCITLSNPEKSQVNVQINSPESGISSDVLLDKISGEYIETSHDITVDDDIPVILEPPRYLTLRKLSELIKSNNEATEEVISDIDMEGMLTNAKEERPISVYPNHHHFSRKAPQLSFMSTNKPEENKQFKSNIQSNQCNTKFYERKPMRRKSKGGGGPMHTVHVPHCSQLIKEGPGIGWKVALNHPLSRVNNILMKVSPSSEPELVRPGTIYPAQSYREMSSADYPTLSLCSQEFPTLSCPPEKVGVMALKQGGTIVSSILIHSTTATARLPQGVYILDFLEYHNIALLVVQAHNTQRQNTLELRYG